MNRTIMIFTAVAVLQFSLSACTGGKMDHSGKYIKKIAVLKNDSTHGAHIIRYRPDGKHIAVTGALNPYIYIYDVETRKRIHKIDKQQKKYGTAMSYDGSGRYLVYERGTNEKRKYNIVIRDVGQDYKLVRDDIPSISGKYYYPAPNGKIIIPARRTRNIGPAIGKTKLSLYAPPTMQVEEFWHNEEGSGKFSISPNGKYMVNVYEEPKGKPGIWDNLYHLRIWKYPEMQLIKTIKNAHKHSITSLVWSWDSKILYTDAVIAFKVYGSDIKLWETQNWTTIKHYQTKEWRSSNISFLPDNNFLFGIAKGSRLFQLFNCYTNEFAEQVEFPDARYTYTLAQNPVKKNQFAFAYETEVWLYEIDLPTKK